MPTTHKKSKKPLLRMRPQIEINPQHELLIETDQITNKLPISGSAQSPSQGGFSLMRLPAELRLLIYSYIVPDSRVRSGSVRRGQTPKPILRQDGGSCCPALLRTSRQVYNEIIEQWYGSPVYCLAIKGNSLHFANQEFKVPSSLCLPSGFELLTNLSITVRLELHALAVVEHYHPLLLGRPYARERTLNLGLLEELSKFFSPQGPGNLKHLEIRVTNVPPFFINMSGIEDRYAGIRASVELNLDPLRKIRASKSVSVKLSEQAPLLGYGRYVQCHLSWPTAEELKEEIIITTGKYFELLEKEISGAHDDKVL